LREAILMHSVARLALHPLIPNIQTSWVKMGPEGAALCLNAGANAAQEGAGGVDAENRVGVTCGTHDIAPAW
jgi:2-iminoacetate synthase ThiH